MQIITTRLSTEKMVFAHKWDNEIVFIKCGTLYEIYNPDNFCDILWVNYMRRVALDGHAAVDVLLLNRDPYEMDEYVKALEPRWQEKEFDPDYDRKFMPHVTYVPTGKVWKSVSDAARKSKISRPHLNNAVRYPSERTKIAGGYWVRTSAPITQP